jgi:hypothetical protein
LKSDPMTVISVILSSPPYKNTAMLFPLGFKGL